jgi:crotonobetainyl-CoA:carnitine CoA-transferase CaiB-like acyl-CoA transferase
MMEKSVTAPLANIRVLEVASWLAAPSCAALMADMGAEVVKVEPPGGDTYRQMYDALLGEDSVHPCYQFDNRGKRGVCVNLEDQDGIAALKLLAKDVDIFLTNLTQERLERYKLTDSDIHALSPTAIYAVLSGYGTDGPDSDRQAFDQTAFWARSGAMSVFGDRDEGPLISRGGYGDRTTALNLLSAILAALRVRDQTGEGQYVEVTLQRTGIWSLASDVCTALYDRVQPEKTSRVLPANPIWNCYRTLDDRWILLVMPMPLAYWPRFCEMVDRPQWINDERFQTVLGMMENTPVIMPELIDMFAAQDMAVWEQKLNNAGLIWEPVSELPDVVEDPALRNRGAYSVIVHDRVGAFEVVSAPFHVRGADIEVRGPAPDAGQHTREVFSGAGLREEQIDALLAKGALR